MTVNEEIDALRTLGQDPQRFLVFPRVLALDHRGAGADRASAT
jgi:ABC-type transporter Mla maintaining outer membrane lipid asymmetry permease subunit MlaE